MPARSLIGTTRTVPPASHCCTTQTVRSVTSSPEGIKQGDVIETGAQADIKPGNNLPLRNIPTGTVVHAIELRPLGGAKIARSASAARAARRQRWRLRSLRYAVRRNPQRGRSLPRDRW